ncbi:thiamine phosphate synthase [Rickettsiales endosymbiont of Peranema trichophorum]|uniref:thiamine phosphate synthase n=1 Tax=Rickettsiales endosymbiont of Peranema trichophorum TaxID=2486577 RepID=UPI0010233BD5|nr:thiamine phosphate synthase [Rickettsiales endosymbiont of Peranema trichophorum]RZI45540.1 thiamine phosphate synthase [Rickettsiales endosymbiont of Peranema trichophorum]
MNNSFLQLMLVTNKHNIPTDAYLQFVEACLKAGVTSVQLREKSLQLKQFLQFGQSLKYLLDSYNVPLIVNDQLEACIKLKANGIHLGQSDTPITTARAALGPDKIIGLSVNTITEAQNAQTYSQSIDYIGVGPIFPTNNKPNVQTVWGLTGLTQVALLSSLPIVAIGGIDTDNAASVMRAGATGIAAIGLFHNAQDPFLITKNLITIITKANQ